jgi:GxxExxY protein
VTENELSGETIGAAIEVHRVLGPGLLESIYEEAFLAELENRNIQVSRQVEVPVVYKEKRLQNVFRLDFLVADLIVVEVKAVEQILPVHEAQLLSYLRLTQRKLRTTNNFPYHRPQQVGSSNRKSSMTPRPLRSLRLCVGC